MSAYKLLESQNIAMTIYATVDVIDVHIFTFMQETECVSGVHFALKNASKTFPKRMTIFFFYIQTPAFIIARYAFFNMIRP